MPRGISVGINVNFPGSASLSPPPQTCTSWAPRARRTHPRAAMSMFRRKSDETLTFHVHALQTHKAAVITGKWLAKPLSQAVIGSFLDQVRGWSNRPTCHPAPTGRCHF